MPLTFNIRHLDREDLHLKGQLPVAELDLGGDDEVVHVGKPLEYDLHVQEIEDAILVTGKLRLDLNCECVRCLKPIPYRIELKDWALHLELKGEEKVPIVNDSIDLTELVREDILLSFPQHPLCRPDCGGLPPKSSKRQKISGQTPKEEVSSPWVELEKLKFK